MTIIALSQAEARAIQSLRSRAEVPVVRAILERSLTAARSAYENTVPANEDLRQDVVAHKRIISFLFDDTVEKGWSK